MSAPNLAALQAALQNDVMHGEQKTLDQLSVPVGAEKADRLGVYQYAYKARLISILATDYDTLWSFLGDQVFHDAADRYLDKHPSGYFNARWVGKGFAEYLKSDPMLQAHPIAAEIAALEWTIGVAFDAENSPVALMEDLAKVPAEQVAQAIFVPIPACTLLKFKTNAHAIYTALKSNQTPPAPANLAEETGVQIWRLELMSRYKKLTTEETALLELSLQGADFAMLCETAAFLDDPDTAAARVAGCITGWLNTGLITRIDIG